MQLPPSLASKISQATVSVIMKGRPHGQAVCVQSGFFVTAAHCILSDFPLDSPVPLQTPYGGLSTKIAFMDLVSDLAVLRSVDGQSDYEAARDFDRYRGASVELSRQSPSPAEEFPVYVRTHQASWISGTARFFEGGSFALITKQKIESGTSGGPVVDMQGQLVGVVVKHDELPSGGKYTGEHALLVNSLPRWLLKLIG